MASKINDADLLSLIVPVYKQEKIIVRNIRQLQRALNTTHHKWELIIVVDGNVDGTWAKLKEAKIKNITCFSYEENRGKAYAIRLGMSKAKGDYVMFIDSGMEIDPNGISMLLEHMKWYDADIIVGSKRHLASHVKYTLERKIYSYGYYYLVKLLFGIKIRDTQAGIKLMKKDVLKKVYPRMIEKKFAGDLELLVIAKMLGYKKIFEAPIKLNYQFSNTSSAATIKGVVNIFVDTLAIFYRRYILQYYKKSHKKFKTPIDLRINGQNIDAKQLKKVTVIIPVKRINNYIRETIPKILESTNNVIEILIVVDKIENKYKNKWRKTRFIESGSVGPAKKRDLAAKKAVGEILAFLDDDAYPTTGWLPSALIHFNDTKVAAVGGPAITPKDNNLFQKVSGAIFESYLGGGKARKRYLSIGKSHEIDDWPTVNLLVRKKAFNRVGGFDSKYWPGEDTKLCLDILNDGNKIIYEPKAIVYHHRRSNLLRHLKQIGNYGLHRGHFAKIYPDTSSKFWYFVPSIIVHYVIITLIVILYSVTSSDVLDLLLVPIFFYIAFVILDGLLISLRKKSFLIGLFTAPMIILTHLWYGLRFQQGLLMEDID